MADIRVLIVDDSILIRKMLTQVLEAAPGIEVVGTASDPLIARDKIKQLNPDVLTLDVEMPRMNGIQFLSNLMRLRPMPVVMVSTLTEAGAPVTLEALEIGAIDYIAKPQIDSEKALESFSRQLVDKVKMAAGARVRPLQTSHQVRFSPQPLAAMADFKRWVVLGASTGGTEAIKAVLSRIPAQCPPILITQHIPAVFSASFAQRLNQTVEPEVLEACDGLEVRPGRVIIAHGDNHLTFRRDGQTVRCVLSAAAPVNRHRPSVEVMFDAITAVRPAQQLVAVMLTGMGMDGAAAMKRLHQSGTLTIAQDEASSVVWGMPRAVVEMAAADKVVALEKVAGEIITMTQL
ncbi:protein-glutamate methylesterase/protein-glutamine glutaminase [Oceanobacter mangrovi]|uniref:protein-glutamate methylesterase/protein-glutamine glutaminase n=1 Tax=Oceanobacter mangrovi TaxID=2862510 RepID=UPI001C8DEF1B|nr:chemotaxis response regulator protein-glutamate methylesterase [Oceanobacter mangrovi]